MSSWILTCLYLHATTVAQERKINARKFVKFFFITSAGILSSPPESFDPNDRTTWVLKTHLSSRRETRHTADHIPLVSECATRAFLLTDVDDYCYWFPLLIHWYLFSWPRKKEEEEEKNRNKKEEIVGERNNEWTNSLWNHDEVSFIRIILIQE